MPATGVLPASQVDARDEEPHGSPDMRSRHRIDLERWSPAVGLAAAVLFIAVPSWPGRINNDVVSMLQDIDDRTISNWHAPILQYLWLPFREIGFGLAPILVAQVAAGYLALFLMLETFRFRRWVCAALSLGLCMHPIGYGLFSSVIRDTWFLVFWLLSLGLARTDRVRSRRRFAAVFITVFFAYAARQNGIVIAPILLMVALSDGAWTSMVNRRRLVRLSLAIAASLSMVAATNLFERIASVQQQRTGISYMSDLVRLSLRGDELLLPPELNPTEQPLERFREVATPYNIEPLLYAEKYVPVELDDVQAAAARDAWIDAVTADPVEYARMRWQLMSRQIGLSGDTRNPFLPAETDNPFGIRPRFPELADRATDYQLTFNRGLNWWQAGAIHRTWPLFVLATIAGWLSWRRRRGGPVTVDIVSSGLAVLASVFLFAPQVQFRFVSPVGFVALVAIISMFAGWTPAPTPLEPMTPTDLGTDGSRESGERQLPGDDEDVVESPAPANPVDRADRPELQDSLRSLDATVARTGSVQDTPASPLRRSTPQGEPAPSA